MSRQLEQKLQERFALYLQARGILFCASAGGMRTSIGTAVKMKRAGYKKGFPDIFIYEPKGRFHGIAFELKVENHSKNEAQDEWIAELNKRGYYAVKVPGKLGLMEAEKFLINELDKYMWGAL